jgi:hypothetical protein
MRASPGRKSGEQNMPKRSKITQLPPDIKAKLDKMLIEGSFSDYDRMADWLNEQLLDQDLELTISKSSIHRYGQNFEEKMVAIKIATEQARAITEAVGDGEGVVGDALTSLCQEKAFQVLVKMGELDPEDVDFTKLTVAVAKLNKASVDQKKWLSEVRVKAKATAEDVVKAVKKGGMSEKTAEEIRKKILGIV